MSRTVLITGGSGAIGAAIAEVFARKGDNLVLGSLHHFERARALGAGFEALGAGALAVRGDVRSEADVDRMFREAEERFGPVDVLVCNAGIARQRLFCDITLEEWREMQDVHVTGGFLCARRALPAMIRAKKGCIVMISSIWGQVGASCEVHYSAAKAALIGMTRALAKEVGPSGVRVNCVAPGAVQTGMMEGFTPEELADFCGGVALGRLGRPEEVAAAVGFLCSEEASYITGQVLSPNGGM